MLICRSHPPNGISPLRAYYLNWIILIFEHKAKKGTMDLQKQACIVDSIHDTLNDFVGQRIKVRANMGRSKIVETEGTLTQVHPRLFIMEVDRKRGRTARQSYQYADVLTGTVELSQNGEPLFSSFVEETTEEFIEVIEEAPSERVLA